MPQTLTPSRRIVNEIRAHFEKPVHQPKRWGAPSLTGDHRREISIAASRDPGVDLGPGRSYASGLHLSFLARVDGEPATMLDDDLSGWARAILGAYLPCAAVDPTAEPGDPHFTPLSHLTVHLHVYLDDRGRAFMPGGPLAVTPWRAA
ncbi:hypothetical protein KVF89_22270 [Nocardioides carbamazepini]|uniref:hypothetical protein n=1 Tax=Nocardioides carbamazepini TaxID=2854259 RepID=UPI00214A1D1D|nr:hypothetical protein [Nocardioides carbamazepini]MCR1785282.1 hypothetical protein [Nocardioides carbamazepini]